MIGIVLVTHGNLAREFLAALEHVTGPQQCVSTVCIGPDDDMEARREDIAKAISDVDDDSGVARFLAARGEGVHHVCLLTDDLPDELDRLATAEAELIDRESRPGAHWSVAFVHPRSLNGVRWELLEEG